MNNAPAMVKPALALFVWLYAGWSAGAFASLVTGAPEALGPVIGALSVGIALLIRAQVRRQRGSDVARG
ncbi:MAG: hypothetical protein HYX57_09775 [Chloroflexi bacterium]|nr:hypothetical protein [Chloroflexota bacterium]